MVLAKVVLALTVDQIQLLCAEDLFHIEKAALNPLLCVTESQLVAVKCN